MDTTLFEKILSATASEKEKQAFEKWLQESESNQLHFEQLKLLWDKTKRIPETVQFNAEAAKKNLRLRVQQRRSLVSKRKVYRTWLSIAASIMLLLGLGLLNNNQQWISLEKTIVYQAQDAVKEVVLYDGSTVWLNAHSSLTAPEKFNHGQRRVKLNGEAYFEVARNEAKPFKIKAGKTVTKVLGTSFNVKMDTIQSSVSVVVNSGKVAFYPKGHRRNGVILLAGDMASFEALNSEINKTKNHNLNYLAWKTHILTFQSAPLKEVCKVLSDYYHKPVTTNLSEDKYVITGKFEKESIEDILSTIQLTLDVNIEETNDQIVIAK